MYVDRIQGFHHDECYSYGFVGCDAMQYDRRAVVFHSNQSAKLHCITPQETVIFIQCLCVENSPIRMAKYY
jgi:hypothetical protein